MAGRAALNLVIANHFRTRRFPAGMTGMAVLTVVDGGLAAVTKARQQRPGSGDTGNACPTTSVGQ
ncbi:hypothetical protein ACWDKQ_17125 [Saccharopolyspora sp. NPDC000995]